ncbi:hypothetical protein O0L34_g2385 [Tuta absoluta]|nr:hypothetical protein O0L34_g2385 [Tuta absoluta]
MSRVYEEEDAGYAAACSDGTLSSPNRGFFRQLADELAALAPPELLEKLPALPERDQLPAFQGDSQVMEALTEVLSRVTPLYRGKDARASQARRESARVALAEGAVDKALALASQAVFRAPPTGSDEALDGGVSLALALWQRSEILLASNCARAALADLRLALKERLPARMRPLYYWRMGNAYKDAGEPTRAKVSYELAGRLMGAGADQAAQAQLAKDIASLDFTVKPQTPVQKPGISVTGGTRQNMPALSKLVKIAEEENRGRFAVANSDIKTGDVLLVDNPYAACLLHDFYGTHCLHCFKRLENNEEEAPLWCPTCSGVAFCSEQCRTSALSTYHPTECQFLDLFIGSGMSILSHIALRMVTQAGLDTTLLIHSKYIANEVKTVEGSALNDIEGSAKKSKMKSRKERLNRSKKGLKMAEKNDDVDVEGKEEELNNDEKLELKAAQIYSLCTHSEQRRGEDTFKRIIMAMFLTECLNKAGFFKKYDQENVKKAEAAICEVLVRNLQLLQFNAHEVYETVRGEHTFSGSRPLYVAVGIYPTGALFNHECYPAVARYFEGRKLVLRAIRPLAPGEAVSENYGPHFLVRTLKERRRALASRYWFRCDCRACKEDWPTLKQMAKDVPPLLRCPNSSCTWKFKADPKVLPGKCPRCSTAVDKDHVKTAVFTVEKCVDLYQDGAKLMDKEMCEEATAAMCSGVDLFDTVGAPPHRDTHLAQEALRSCFAIGGNVHKVRAQISTEVTLVSSKQ